MSMLPDITRVSVTNTHMDSAGPFEESVAEVLGGFLDMHEVAITSAVTRVLVILTTARLTKVGDRRELAHERASSIISVSDSSKSLCCVTFVEILNVNVTHQVIAKISADEYFFHFTVLRHFQEHVFIKFIEELLCGLYVEEWLAIRAILSIWRLEHIHDDQRL